MIADHIKSTYPLTLFPMAPSATPRRRRATQADKLFDVLSDFRWHTTKELARRVGHSFTSAVGALEREGFHVTQRSHPRRRWQYQYRIGDEPTQAELPLPTRP